jgi:hypothetical protein
MAAMMGCGGGGAAGGTSTLGAAEGYLYANTDCDSASGPAYTITDSAVPPPSYETVADVSVMLSAHMGDEFRNASTKTAADGHFSVRDMPPGSYSVLTFSADVDASRYFSPLFTVTLESGKTTKRFETSWPASFTAYGTYDCNDADWPFAWQTSSGGARHLLSGVQVEVERSVRCRVSVEIDASGRIALDNLQAGLYALTVPVEACGKIAVCYLAVDNGSRVVDEGCRSSPETATAQLSAALP